MTESEYLTLTITFGEENKVASVAYNGKVIFLDVKWGVVMHYMENLKDKGWRVVKVSPTESGEIYLFKLEGA